MLARVLAVLRARLGATGSGELPWAAILIHAFLSGTLALLLRADLPVFPFALAGLSLTGALVAIPLLGELGFLLRRDSAEDWIGALPIRPRELAAARALHAAIAVGALASGSLVPFALLYPDGAGLAVRAGHVLAGLGLATVLCGALFAVQSVLADRVESALVLLQTTLVVGVLVGLVRGLGELRALARVGGPDELPLALRALAPSAWFAAPLAPGAGAGATIVALAATVAAALALLLLPAPRPAVARARGGALDLLLAPLRALATRLWVRRGERAAFDLVYDALPREREVVLRTYPMIGIPIAFLLAGSFGGSGEEREGLLALLLFTAGTYLPILVVQVPASASAAASWILESAPVSERDVREGAIKALAVRFLAPLYLALGLITWRLGGWSEVGRFALPGAVVSLLVVRATYRRLATAPPLSVLPDEVQASPDWFGALLGVALALTVVAAIALRRIESAAEGALLAAALFAVELALERRGRRAVAAGP